MTGQELGNSARRHPMLHFDKGLRREAPVRSHVPVASESDREKNEKNDKTGNQLEHAGKEPAPLSHLFPPPALPDPAFQPTPGEIQDNSLGATWPPDDRPISSSARDWHLLPEAFSRLRLT